MTCILFTDINKNYKLTGLRLTISTSVYSDNVDKGDMSSLQTLPICYIFSHPDFIHKGNRDPEDWLLLKGLS